jgi:hypothetical protein
MAYETTKQQILNVIWVFYLKHTQQQCKFSIKDNIRHLTCIFERLSVHTL